MLCLAALRCAVLCCAVPSITMLCTNMALSLWLAEFHNGLNCCVTIVSSTFRYEQEQQWAAQQQAQPSLSQPQTQSRFAQEQASQLRAQQPGIPQQAGVDSNGTSSSQQSYAPAMGQVPLSMSMEGAGLSSSLLEGYRMQQRAVAEQGSSATSRYVGEEVWSAQQHQPHAKAAPQHTLSEFEQQGGAAAISPLKQSPAAYSDGDPVEYSVMSGLNPRGGHRSQHSLSELEHQGSWVEAGPPQQGFPSQPSARGPSPQEVELVAAQAAPGRDSPTRDLTELEQQGSFTLTSDPSQVQQGNSNPAQAGQAEAIAGAEMARELARRKGAQAELERQYSQLQLQHQQVCISLPIAVSNLFRKKATGEKAISNTRTVSQNSALSFHNSLRPC